MGSATRLLVNFHSMEVSNLLDLLRSGVADCLLLQIYRTTLRPQGGAVVPMIPIISGEEVSLIPQACPMFPEVVPLTPVLLICRGVLLVYTLLDVVSAKIFFTVGVIRVCGASTIGFTGRVWTGTSPMVRKLNNFPSKITLLVWVTVSGLLVRSPCVSLTVAFFNSYPALFIFKLLIALASLSDLSSFALVNTASVFYLCELDAWLNASAVMLLACIIDSSWSSITTFKIDSWIFA